MKKDQVISRLCGLISRVGNDVFESKESMDCICGCNPLVNNSDNRGAAVVDDKIVEFIEEAVLKAVNDAVLARKGMKSFSLLTAVAAEILKGSKSSIVAQACEQKNLVCTDLKLDQVESSDIKGLPNKGEVNE